jgi:chromosome segregation ATPase
MPPKAKADAKPKAKGEPKKKKEEEEEIPKMKPPDTEAHQQAVQAINDEIDKLRSEKQAVQDVMAKRSDGRDDYYKQRSEMREQLNEIHKNLEQYESRKEGISTDIGKKEQEKKDQRLQINKLKRNIGYENEGEIDDRIATIEFKLWTESISLKEEKKILAGDCRA